MKVTISYNSLPNKNTYHACKVKITLENVPNQYENNGELLTFLHMYNSMHLQP